MPTQSRTARAYNGLVPSAVRNRLPARVRRAGVGWETRGFRRGNAAFIGDRDVVHLQDRCFVVETDPAMVPLKARRATLDTVTGALDAAGVPYFCLRALVPTESAVAVAATDRKRAVAALRPALAAAGGYVGPVKDPDGLRSGFGDAAWAALAAAKAFRVTRFFRPAGSGPLLGPDFGCVVEFWDAEDGPSGPELVAPRYNRVAESVPAEGETAMVTEDVLTPLAPRGSAPRYRTRAAFDFPLLDEVDFPVDAVYTWVDGSDPAWRERRSGVLSELDQPPASHLSANDSRYHNREELRYSIRGLEMFAPWINHIYLVTDDQTPSWLDVSNPRITVVHHKDLFGDRGALPTFNSHAIETQLHHIEGLSEHFLYFNDDVFLGKPLTADRFFHPNGIPRFFPSRAQLGLETRTPDDAPAIAAGKNIRDLVEKTFGRTVTQRVMHTPHPIRRSLLAEVTERFADEAEATAGRRFRHAEDVSFPSFLHGYYGMLTGRVVPGEMAFRYIDLGRSDAPERMRKVLRDRDFDCFCVNDTDVGPFSPEEQLEMTQRFLESYFPVPSAFEIG